LRDGRFQFVGSAPRATVEAMHVRQAPAVVFPQPGISPHKADEEILGR